MLPGQVEGNEGRGRDEDQSDESEQGPQRQSIPLSDLLSSTWGEERAREAAQRREADESRGQWQTKRVRRRIAPTPPSPEPGTSSQAHVSAPQGMPSLAYDGGQHDDNEEAEAPPPSLDTTFSPHAADEPRTYELFIRQSPRHGRVCTLGSRNRRVLDPLPILQLIIRDQRGRCDESAQSSPYLMMQVTLVVANEATRRELPPSASPQYLSPRVLEGKLTSSAHTVRDTDGQRACFFLFPDLSIRFQGSFRLHFALIRLGIPLVGHGGRQAGGQIECECTSEPFFVYHPRHYPGMSESTPLARALANQGVQIPIRNESRASRSEA